MWLRRLFQHLLSSPSSPAARQRKSSHRAPAQPNRQPPASGNSTPSSRKSTSAARAGNNAPRGQRSDFRTYTAYHGTPRIDNARAIFQHGFLVGAGNLAGDGVYFSTDLVLARSYAGPGGAILKCQLAGRACHWDAGLQVRYDRWCRTRGVRQDNSARTAFLLQQGFDLLQNGNVIVVLAPQMANPSAWQRKDRRIRPLGVYRASDNQRIRV